MKTLAIHGGFVVVDDEDEPLVRSYSWHVNKRRTVSYATAYIGGGRKAPKRAYLHRLVLKARTGQQIDHANGDGLDCRKINLRFCTTQENRRNRRKTGGMSKYFPDESSIEIGPFSLEGSLLQCSRNQEGNAEPVSGKRHRVFWTDYQAAIEFRNKLSMAIEAVKRT